ncbi:hypothetical protein J43TS3_10100 [Ornithinibacillus bavariensis]|uniref:Uncharacterized protein n=1 Tax=Ornithinibacillus bavariensis TaxID=545502 RepID=A0A919X7D2_9BACI|nr:hypothetical protein J43TS3_10100 [Ornithinibacillus bavariensis]
MTILSFIIELCKAHWIHVDNFPLPATYFIEAKKYADAITSAPITNLSIKKGVN